MKNLFKAMSYEHLKLHGLMLALLLGAVIVQRTLSVDLVGPGLGFYAWACFLLLLVKPYSAKNWTWLRDAACVRSSLLGFVLSESLITIPFGLISFLLILFWLIPLTLANSVYCH